MQYIRIFKLQTLTIVATTLLTKPYFIFTSVTVNMFTGLIYGYHKDWDLTLAIPYTEIIQSPPVIC